MECELCGDQPVVLRAKCHFTAPLRAVLDNNRLELRCYVPECDKLVIAFRVEEI
jgi:hypothetical protein